ncbi:MAG: FtsW/RodA/SpoVE family cell cycle protein, partial [Selenomonadaceae bacterium]|nr:FtsW/RodA/SpoVE family cell cycle protein [Selenomonadaceae bacterium]
TGNKSYVFIALLFFGVAAAVSYALFGHVRVRFDIWLNPWQDPSGMAYQVVQSMFSFGSGGIWGTGFAHGHPELIPEVHTDFIFAAVAEELGLIGSLLLMLIYALFFYEGIRIALGCREEGQIFLVAGCDIVFFLPAFIIIAGVTKFLPLTGITLPFVSYGGSSIVSCFILLGVMVSLSRKERNAHG